MAAQDYTQIPTRPATFRGALAFNQRTVTSAVASLLGASPTGTPISFAELSNVLLVLESIATSSALCLDGTLPPADIESLQDELWRVKARSGVDVPIEFLRPSARELVGMFKSSAEAAALLVQESLSELDQQSDAPLGGDIAKFVDALSQVSRSSAPADLAHDIAEYAARGVETFRGSKCLAGLILADRDPVPLLDLALNAVVGASDARQRKTIAVLINRFRINYVNSLATMRDGAYLADTSIENLKAAQIVLFSRYLASKIADVHAQELTDATREQLDQHLAGVPLGFAILMNSPGTSAVELVVEAMKIRDASFAAAAARDTPQERFLHQLTDDEFSDFRDYLFKARWGRLMNAAARSEFEICRWRCIRIPAAVGGVVGAVAGSLLGGPVGLAAGAGLGSLLGSATQFLGEELGNGRLGGHTVGVDQYRKLDQYFALAARNDKFTQTLTERIAMLFGRQLSPAVS